MLERIRFFRQLAVAMKSGLPLERALSIQSSHAGDKKLKAALGETLKAVRGGKSLSDSLFLAAKRHGFFQATELALVRMGERSGQLPQSLDLLASQLEEAYKLKQLLKESVVYPIWLLYLGILLLPARLLFEPGLGLPSYVRAVFPGLFWLSSALLLFTHFLKKPPFQEALYRSFARVPLFGKPLRKIFLIRFTTLLALAYKAGMDAASALRLAGQTTPDREIRKATAFAALAAERGKGASEALSRYPKVFPGTFLEFYRTGEECGAIDEMLLKQAHLWEDELRPALKNLVNLASRLILLLVLMAMASQIIQQARLGAENSQKQINELLKDTP